MLETGLFTIYNEKDYKQYEAKKDMVYLNFDNKDKVAYIFKTTLENNKLNLSQIAMDAIPNIKNKYCVVCGKEFNPANNKQRQCTECKEKYKKEQARLRKQKQRKREKQNMSQIK